MHIHLCIRHVYTITAVAFSAVSVHARRHGIVCVVNIGCVRLIRDDDNDDSDVAYSGTRIITVAASLNGKQGHARSR